jgi:hypothetical protein
MRFLSQNKKENHLKGAPQYFDAKKPFECVAQKAFDFFDCMYPLSILG